MLLESFSKLSWMVPLNEILDEINVISDASIFAKCTEGMRVDIFDTVTYDGCAK